MCIIAASSSAVRSVRSSCRHTALKRSTATCRSSMAATVPQLARAVERFRSWQSAASAAVASSGTMAGMTLADLVPTDPDPDALYDAFNGWVEAQGLSLYPAQQDALIELFSGSNVILSTPTGSGKSL